MRVKNILLILLLAYGIAEGVHYFWKNPILRAFKPLMQWVLVVLLITSNIAMSYTHNYYDSLVQKSDLMVV